MADKPHVMIPAEEQHVHCLPGDIWASFDPQWHGSLVLRQYGGGQWHEIHLGPDTIASLMEYVAKLTVTLDAEAKAAGQ